jgi:hypothetical protein
MCCLQETICVAPDEWYLPHVPLMPAAARPPSSASESGGTTMTFNPNSAMINLASSPYVIHQSIHDRASGPDIL